MTRVGTLKRHLHGLAPSWVYLATHIATRTGGLLHHRFTLTNIAIGGLLSVALVPRIAPGGNYPQLCPLESGLSSVLWMNPYQRGDPGDSS